MGVGIISRHRREDSGGGPMSDSSFIKAIDDLLTINGNLSFPQNSRVAHGNTRYKNGTPDILVMRRGDGAFFGLELKQGSDTVSKDQKEMLSKINGIAIGAGLVIWNDRNYMDVLRAAGLID